MKLRHVILPKGRHRRPPVIAYNPLHKARCPYCASLDTLYVPVITEGHCNACGKSWRFLADPDAGFERPKVKPTRIAYSDLVGFCVAMTRLKVSHRQARERYARLNIAEPAEETWERAWREAKDFA